MRVQNNNKYQDNVYSAMVCGKAIARVHSGQVNECELRVGGQLAANS